MNTLSFYTEPFEVEEFGRQNKYLAFYFQVDGKTILAPDDTYNPANCFDLTDKEATEYNMVVLWHCTCGVWQCSSIVATVSELENDIIEWKIHQLGRGYYKIFHFAKKEYDKVMSEIIKIAEQQISIETKVNDKT